MLMGRGHINLRHDLYLCAGLRAVYNFLWKEDQLRFSPNFLVDVTPRVTADTGVSHCITHTRLSMNHNLITSPQGVGKWEEDRSALCSAVSDIMLCDVGGELGGMELCFLVMCCAGRLHSWRSAGNRCSKGACWRGEAELSNLSLLKCHSVCRGDQIREKPECETLFFFFFK